MAAHDITPTRSVLLDLKRRIKLSQSGHKILKMKRDGLIIEFFEVMEKARQMRAGVATDFEVAMKKITIARAIDGEVNVRSAAYALNKYPTVKLSSKSIMGMMVPKVEADSIHTDILNKGYGVLDTSAYVEEAAASFEKLLETLIRAAEVETTMKKLLDEIEKTKRRVNALEFKIIPDLKESERFVKFRLEEMERENTTRLKHIKKKGAEEKHRGSPRRYPGRPEKAEKGLHRDMGRGVRYAYARSVHHNCCDLHGTVLTPVNNLYNPKTGFSPRQLDWKLHASVYTLEFFTEPLRSMSMPA